MQQTLNGGLRSMTQLLSFQRLANAAAEGRPEEELVPLRQKASAIATSLVRDYAMISCIALLDAKGIVQAHNDAGQLGTSSLWATNPTVTLAANGTVPLTASYNSPDSGITVSGDTVTLPAGTYLVNYSANAESGGTGADKEIECIQK